MALSQTARILRLLQAKGTVSNRELNQISYRYSARILELRLEGHRIVSNHVKDGLWEYAYFGEAS